ncbi:MAG: alpha/beta hydrolase [Deltaproteobacteria bacterium]|nr:alpha/beta hydrolase [Nannocystaceae bacterium]
MPRKVDVASWGCGTISADRAMHLVLMPGMDGTGVLFQPLLEQLAPSESACVIRYPGDEQLGYDELLATVERALPTAGRYALIAESFSGPLALRVAARNPVGLAAVVLAASFVTNPLRLVPRWAAALASPWLFATVPKHAQAWAVFDGAPSEPLRELFREAQTQVLPAVMAARARAIMRVDATADLRACPVPVSYLQAIRDRVVSASCLRRNLVARPDVAVRRIDAPHLILQTAPAQSLVAIRGLLAHA